MMHYRFLFSKVSISSFNADGSFASMDRPGAMLGYIFLPIEGYRNQAVYLNGLVTASVQDILERSDTPPIIIIQGDHGPASDWYSPAERMPILNAYYLPEDGERHLYPEITPVNSFRLIFELYFGQHFGLLPDQSYNSPLTSTFLLCEYHEGQNDETRADQMQIFLEANNFRMKVDDCAFDSALPFRHGFYLTLFENGVGYRLANRIVRLQLPVRGAQDYIFGASVDHVVSADEQQVNVFVGEALVTTVGVPHGSGEYKFTIPAEFVGEGPLLELILEHRNVSDQPLFYDYPVTTSLKYYDISWRSA